MPMKLFYITNKLEVALIAEKYGVDRIWVDLETLGKAERQKHMDTVKSHHSIQDIRKISKLLSKAELMVRINPWNETSADEIEKVIAAGADRIMLPMWKSFEEADAFLKTVNGRVKTNLLLETKEAVECLDEILEHPLLEEIHIGLNDLHLSYGLTFMFELIPNGMVEALCKKIKAKGIPYGFGGIARIGEGLLPAERIIVEHHRVGSTMANLSRSFCNTDKVEDLSEVENVFAKNMQKIRDFEKTLTNISDEEYEENSKEIRKCVKIIVATIKERRECAD